MEGKSVDLGGSGRLKNTKNKRIFLLLDDKGDNLPCQLQYYLSFISPIAATSLKPLYGEFSHSAIFILICFPVIFGKYTR